MLKLSGFPSINNHLYAKYANHRSRKKDHENKEIKNKEMTLRINVQKQNIVTLSFT